MDGENKGEVRGLQDGTQTGTEAQGGQGSQAQVGSGAPPARRLFLYEGYILSRSNELQCNASSIAGAKSRLPFMEGWSAARSEPANIRLRSARRSRHVHRGKEMQEKIKARP